METLDGHTFDVLIAGTGIQQSLLALALSRSDRKVLHVDSNDYYGGAEAALSLQEAESWVERTKRRGPQAVFRNASIIRADDSTGPPDGPRLAASRAYSLSLCPNVLYTRSALLPILVSSRIHQHLEFQAVANWFVYQVTPELQLGDGKEPTWFSGRLVKVPNSREDIFGDSSLNLRAKGALVKLLRFVATHEENTEIWEPYKERPFQDFLVEHFKIPAALHGPVLALTMGTETPDRLLTGFALARIAGHMRSIGVFGPGFAAVLPKWGGLSEVVQTACRAGAVGGTVYVLNKGVTSITAAEPKDGEAAAVDVGLDGRETVKVQFVVGTRDQLPLGDPAQGMQGPAASVVTRGIHIVSSTLPNLFPAPTDGSPAPAGAVITLPSGSLRASKENASLIPPVHIMAHTSDTGECAAGQCVLYASIALPIDKAARLLEEAVALVLAKSDDQQRPRVLWSMTYEQRAQSPYEASAGIPHVHCFPDPSLDPVFDENIIDNVKNIWQEIVGPDVQGFMQFQEREDADEMDAEEQDD